MRPIILLVGLGCFLAACSPTDVGRDRSNEKLRGAELSTEEEEKPPQQAVRGLGVQIRSVGERSIAVQIGLPRVIRGAYVKRVIARTPAARAGLKRGDVITEIRVGKGDNQLGYSIESSGGLDRVLTLLKDRDHFGVEVFRGPAPLNRSSYATRLFQVRLQRT